MVQKHHYLYEGDRKTQKLLIDFQMNAVIFNNSLRQQQGGLAIELAADAWCVTDKQLKDN